MVFNENLISNYTGHNYDLAKYILFSIKEDIRLNSALTNKLELNSIDVKMAWSENILGDAQQIIIDFIAKGVIIPNNYEGTHSRYTVIRPLYVTSLVPINLSDDFITACRNPFFKSYCKRNDRNSSPILVKKLLIQFIENNGFKKIENIPSALKLMVDERMKDNPNFVTKLSTFIDPYNEEKLDGKNLLYYAEEYERSKVNPKRSNFI